MSAKVYYFHSKGHCSPEKWQPLKEQKKNMIVVYSHTLNGEDEWHFLDKYLKNVAEVTQALKDKFGSIDFIIQNRIMARY